MFNLGIDRGGRGIAVGRRLERGEVFDPRGVVETELKNVLDNVLNLAQAEEELLLAVNKGSWEYQLGLWCGPRVIPPE
jgi:hypothetical protein